MADLPIPPYGTPPHTPTQDAYDAACVALARHRERADRAEAAVQRVRALPTRAEAVTGSPWGDIEDPTPIPGWTTLVENALNGPEPGR